MLRLLLAALALSTLTVASAADLQGRVVGVTDGDTLTLLTADKRQVKVRLAEIDTPESGQPYGKKARQALANLVQGRQARVDVADTDRYGRSIARVWVGGVDINRQLVADGAAWVYRQYNRDASLLAVEAEARAARRGLWALSETERQAPWEWRRGLPAVDPRQPLLIAANDSTYSCSPRKTCGQMSSCAEARYHLETCGNTRLDRDNDGIPCESLCN